MLLTITDPQALAEFKRHHPRVAVSVLVETSDVMIALLERGVALVEAGRDEEAYALFRQAVVEARVAALVTAVMKPAE